MKRAFYLLILLIPVVLKGQIITTIAGTGVSGYSGDAGPATAATIHNPYGIAVDHSGNTYFVDYGNHVVRKIDASGVITTIAGTGANGYNGDGIAATSALLNYPFGIATDLVGNIYVADGSNNRIRKIDPSGMISTVAGTGVVGFSGDGGPATLAKISNMYCMAVDAGGNIFFTGNGAGRIRKINSAGYITTIAGNGINGFAGDGGPATAAEFSNEMGIATDAAGNVYVADRQNHRIRKINSSGIISTFAGTGTAAYSGDGGQATAATLSLPGYVITDRLGNVYISEVNNKTIRKVNTSGIISTIAGIGTAGFSGDGCAAIAAQLNSPAGIAVDSMFNLFISDNANNRIRKVIANTAPHFSLGPVYSLNACADSDNVIDAALPAANNYTGLTETWSVAKPALHGVVTGTFTATSTGTAVTPSGLIYTPFPMYVGNDTFKIKVTDCSSKPDTITIIAAITDCRRLSTPIVDPTSAIVAFPNPVKDILNVASGKTIEKVHITNMMGMQVLSQVYQSNKVQVDLSSLPAGVYFVWVTESGNYPEVRRIIKE